MSTVDSPEVEETSHSQARSTQISVNYCRAADPLMARLQQLRMQGITDVPEGASVSVSGNGHLMVRFAASHGQSIIYAYHPSYQPTVAANLSHTAEELRAVPRRARKSQGYWFGKLIALVTDLELKRNETYQPDWDSLLPTMRLVSDNLEQIMRLNQEHYDTHREVHPMMSAEGCRLLLLESKGASLMMMINIGPKHESLDLVGSWAAPSQVVVTHSGVPGYSESVYPCTDVYPTTIPEVERMYFRICKTLLDQLWGAVTTPPVNSGKVDG